MVSNTLKRIAVSGALAGAMGFAALGLGSGTASADPGLPFDPDSLSGDWQTYIPMVTEGIPVITETIKNPDSFSPIDLVGLRPPGVI